MTQSKIYGNYVGWVPCLNGQLVFDLVECGLKNGDSTEIVHYARNDNRTLTEYLILHSTVDWKDFDDEEDQLSGLWSVIVLSERSIDSSKHTGNIYFMLNKKDDNNKPWYESIEITHKINYQLNTEQYADVPKRFLGLEKKLKHTCSTSENCYKAKFVLEQDGVVWIEPLSNDDNERKIIARQAYYYIKYSWHKHQHHDARAETLTTAHKIEDKNAEIYLANSLIGDLKRNLVKFKREIDITSYRDILKAKGIVSYTKALVEIMKSKEFIDNDFYRREINHLEYFQESLDVISSGIEQDMSLHNQAVNNARAFILFLFAMITPALLINKGLDSPPSYIRWISNWYSNGLNFTFLIAFITTFLFFYISVTSYYGNFWIFWGGIKKLVALVVKDREPNTFFSNSSVLSILLIIVGIFILFFGLHGLNAALSEK
jgi:hypothetical protein